MNQEFKRWFRNNDFSQYAAKGIGLSLMFLLVMTNAITAKCESNVRPSPTEMWEVFSSSILSRAKSSDDPKLRTELLDQGLQMVLTNRSDAFSCKILYCLGVEYFKQGSIEASLNCCKMSLELPETQSGNHISAWNLIAECYKTVGQADASIEACDQVLRSDGPSIMKDDLHQAAMTRKAYLILTKTNLSADDRLVADNILLSLTEIDNSGPFNERRGQMVRTRITNLKESGRFRDAYETGDYFVRKYSSDPYAPLICADISKLTNRYASSLQLAPWVAFFTTNGIAMSAALANLKLDLMNAYAREGMLEKAAEIGGELQSFEKQKSDDIPWGKSHLESVANVTTVVKGEIERKTKLGLPVSNESKPVNRHIVITLLLVSGVLVPAVVLWLLVFRRRR